MTDPDELATLKRKLAARERVGGYGANIEALKARIAELEAPPPEPEPEPDPPSDS